MVRSDWTQYGAADTDYGLATTQVYEGASSLEISAVNSIGADILSQSATDAPDSVRFEWQGYIDSSYGGMVGFFQFQDFDNYVAAALVADGNGPDSILWLIGRESGSFVQYDEYIFADRYLNDVILSDGSDAGGRFVPYRLDLWTDSSGDYRARLEEDADGDGSYTQLGNDVVATSSAVSAGGGVGVGGYPDNFQGETRGGGTNSDPHHMDALDVYY